jgi:hypothetical protein
VDLLPTRCIEQADSRPEMCRLELMQLRSEGRAAENPGRYADDLTDVSPSRTMPQTESHVSNSSTGQRPLWHCPGCGRSFANRNQTHTCAQHDLESHFAGKSRTVRGLFNKLVSILENAGPVTVLPEKTRIAFHVRMSFCAVSVRKNSLVGHFVFGRRVDHPRFLRVETYSPRNHLHAFRIATYSDFDTEFEEWAREAYAVGEQRHLADGVRRQRRP